MGRIEFDELPEFGRDKKYLSKRFRSLPDDLAVLMKVLNDEPNEVPPLSFQIVGLGTDTCVIKVKKIACKSLKGRGVNSGLRLIYAYFPERKSITFIELYYKGDKENEDRARILVNFGKG